MNILYDHKNKSLVRLFNDPITFKLIEYFQALTQPVILRQIRADLKTISGLDKRLDGLIASGVIKRSERRYTYQLKELTDWPNDAKLQAQLEKIVETHSIGEIIEAATKILSYQLPQVAAIDFDLPQVTSLENEQYKLVTVNAGSIRTVTIPNYFYLKENMDELPAEFTVLTDLLGDVETEFYFNQVGLIIEGLEAGKLRTRRPNIFRESLVVTKLLDLQNRCLLLTPETLSNQGDLTQQLTDWFQDNPTAYFVFQQWLSLKVSDSVTYLVKKGGL